MIYLKQVQEPKLTVVSYCHEKHKSWIPHWCAQIASQTFQEFNVLFISHNWSAKEAQGIIYPCLNAINKNLLERVEIKEFHSAPIIGKVINFAIDKLAEKAGKNIYNEWLAHFDLDDWMHPQRLELQYNFIKENPEISFCFARMTGCNQANPDPKMFELDYIEPNEPFLEVSSNEEIKKVLESGANCLGHSSAIYRIQVMKSIGGFSTSDCKIDGIHPDYSTWKKAIRAGYSFYRMPQHMLIWNLTSSVMRN